MGYMRHHAILVTSWDEQAIEQAHQEATLLVSPLVTPIVMGAANSESTFAVVPDGSKEGWETSDEYVLKREAFIGWLRAQVYEDGSSRFRWVEVQYGDDNWEAKVTRSSDDDQKAFRVTAEGIEQYGPVSVHHSSASEGD